MINNDFENEGFFTSLKNFTNKKPTLINFEQ